jgi:hypothetical protein
VNPEEPITKAASYNECLGLMHRLMAYRHEPIHSELMKIRDKYSMLHLDVLILIYRACCHCERSEESLNRSRALNLPQIEH